MVQNGLVEYQESAQLQKILERLEVEKKLIGIVGILNVGPPIPAAIAKMV